MAKIILEENKKTVIFCRSVHHADEFQKFIPNSQTFHSKKTKAENRETLKLFRENKLQYIITVDKFNEGIDVPDTEVIVFLRNTASERIFKQQLGRGLRKYDKKNKVLVFDFVANLQRVTYVEEMARKIWENKKNDINEEFDVLGGDDKKDYPIRISGKGFEFNFTKQQIDLLNFFKKTRGTSFYSTWQEASEAAIKFGINSRENYYKNYKQDPRLPSNPSMTYNDFPDWKIFLGKNKKNFYSTWQEASEAAIKLGIKNQKEYRINYKKDSRLPSEPWRSYSNFPEWNIFLNKTCTMSKFYEIWQEASKITIKLGIKTYNEYKKNYK